MSATSTHRRGRPLLIAFFVIAALVALLHRLAPAGFPPAALLATRWAAIAVLVVYGFVRRTLTSWIFIAMVLGAEVGHDWPRIDADHPGAANFKVCSDIFLHLIKCIIAPLIFSTLVVGIAGHADLKKVGRMGVKALVYFEVITTFALFIGLGAINLSKAGVGIKPPAVQTEEAVRPARPPTWQEVVVHTFPENIAKSVAEGEVLQVVVFSIIFSIAMAMLPTEKRQVMLHWCESLSEIMFKFTNVVMLLAPIGVGGAIAFLVSTMGLSVFGNLAKLLGTLYGALAAFMVLVLFPVALIARVPVRRFIRAVSEPVTIAFATASSEAALPRAMEAMVAIGAPRQTVAFVMPTGYSFNLDGSTLYLSLASVFVAQAAGIYMSFGQQLVMVFTLMLTSKGVAGVPRATLVILLGTAASFKLPEWPIFAIMGIDALMDMARTATNVTGNCLATCVVSRWEGDFGTAKADATVQCAAGQQGFLAGVQG